MTAVADAEALAQAAFRAAWRRIDVDDSPMCRCKAMHLYRQAYQALGRPGALVECGVYRGASASLIAAAIEGSGKELHLYDTFAGIAGAQEGMDTHHDGDFGDVSLEAVKAFVPSAIYHVGPIPSTFDATAPADVAMLHIDLDVFQPHLDTIDFFWNRLVPGGVIIFDDYNQPSCRGARLAIDLRFMWRVPVIETTQGQGLLVKP